MRLILKHTFKNIFHKAGRTLLIFVCVFMCSLVACICFDLLQSLDRMIANTFSSMVGSTDIIYSADNPISDDFEEELPGCRVLRVIGSGQEIYRRDPSYYSYAVRNDITVLYADMNVAADMKMLSEAYDIGLHETIMTDEDAERFELAVGDTLVFYDSFDNPIDFTISRIVPKEGLFSASGGCVCLVNKESMEELGQTLCRQAFIDVLNDRQVSSVCDRLEETHFDATVENIMHNEQLQDLLDMITTMFSIALIVCLMVVVIVTVTISDRIINERMSVVGTFRSLGVSQGRTAQILLLENVIYALMGTIPAIIVYLLIRDSLLEGVFTVDGVGSIDYGHMSIWTMLEIVLGMCLIECACTLKEVLKASRTAVRDIIFDNRDSAYRHSRSATIVGICLFAASCITFFIKRNAVAQGVCMVGILVGSYLLYPYLAELCTGIMESVAVKLGHPVCRLAYIQARTKKCDMASGSLIVVACAVAVVLFTFADSEQAMLDFDGLDGDVILSVTTRADEYYFSYIEDMDDVESVDMVYESMMVPSTLNGQKITTLGVVAAGDYQLYHEIIDMPYEVGNDQVYIDKRMCDKYGVQIGDTVDIVLNTESYIPYTFHLEVAGVVDGVYVGSGETIVISKDNYELYNGLYPSYVLAKAKEGADIDALVHQIDKYSSTMAEVKSIEDYKREQSESTESESRVVKGIGFAGIVLVLIGVISNQLIGFEGRKKEFAGLMSVSMSRGKLEKMLFIESVAMSLIPLIVSFPLGIISSYVLFNVFGAIGLTQPIVIRTGNDLMILAALLVVFSLTVLFPYVKLRRMNIAEQLKYE